MNRGPKVIHMPDFECPHAQTKAIEDGLWECVSCGLAVLVTERRECGECAHIRQDAMGWAERHSCTKLGQSVKPRQLITYRICEGTCFESK